MADSYAVFFPSTGNAYASDFGQTFTTPAKVDFFPGTTGFVSQCFVPLDDWSQGVDQTVTISSSGSGAGKIDFKPVSISRAIDSLSSQFLVNCAAGTFFKYVDILVPKGGTSTPVSYLGYRFGQAAIASMDWRIDGGTTSEVLTLEYGTLTIGYAPQNPKDGTLGAPVFRGWDRIRNVKI